MYYVAPTTFASLLIIIDVIADIELDLKFTFQYLAQTFLFCLLFPSPYSYVYP